MKGAAFQVPGPVSDQHVARYQLVVIGCSLGGMHALAVIFGALSKEFALPVAVVQHRYKTSNEGLPPYLRRHSDISVVDADDKQWLRPGQVILAPADYHLFIDRSEGRGEVTLSVDDAVGYSRPSIDVLFESAAESFGAGVIAVILTGANSDGARGAARIKQAGGFVVVQDPSTAEAPAMPEAVLRSVRVDRILPLDRIGPFLVELSRITT